MLTTLDGKSTLNFWTAPMIDVWSEETTTVTTDFELREEQGMRE